MSAATSLELRQEIIDLDPESFSKHPDGYTCRCGLPDMCVCPTDFPLNTHADLVAEVQRLRVELAGWEEDDDPSLVDERARYPHVVVQLTGEDGNAFSTLAEVTTALRRAGLPQEVRDEFRKQATSGDYEHLLRTCTEWVTVR